MNKYLADFFLCICFYILVFVIVLASSNLNLKESLILIAYCTLSSLFFPFVANFFRGVKKGEIPLQYWNNGVFTLCLVLSLPLGLFLVLYKMSKR